MFKCKYKKKEIKENKTKRFISNKYVRVNNFNNSIMPENQFLSFKKYTKIKISNFFYLKTLEE